MRRSMIADWHGIVRKLVRGRDGRVDPRVEREDSHDEGGRHDGIGRP
jgi:hypothetical protein